MRKRRLWGYLVLSFALSVALLMSIGAVFAAPSIEGSSAPCYATAREELGTVLPSGWSAGEQADCSTQVLTVITSADLARCYWPVRHDLGTVLPSYPSGYGKQVCGQLVTNGGLASTR